MPPTRRRRKGKRRRKHQVREGNGDAQPTHDLLASTSTIEKVIYNLDPAYLKESFIFEQEKDDYTERIRKFLKNPDTINEHKIRTRKFLNKEGENFFLNEDGLLCRQARKTGREEPTQIVVPKIFTEMIIEKYHVDLLACHPGQDATLRHIQQSFFWPGMTADVHNFVGHCKECLFYKKPPRMTSPLAEIKVMKPFDLVGLDVAGPFPVSGNDNRFVVGFIDYFSSFLVAKAVPETSAATIANIYLESWCMYFGAPTRLMSDRGSNVAGQTMQLISEILGTSKITTTAFHPKANGKIERIWATLKEKLAMYTDEQKDDWCKFVPYYVCAHNVQPTQGTSYSPIEILLGEKPELPIEKALIPTRKR